MIGNVYVTPEPPYCNQSGMDLIRKQRETIEAQQAELDAARAVIAQLRKGMSLMPGAPRINMNKLGKLVNAYDAARNQERGQ